jgi:hypothetical protein
MMAGNNVAFVSLKRFTFVQLGGNMKLFYKIAFYLLLMPLLLASPALMAQFAQRGGLEGNVLDSSNAVIPNVSVTLVDVAHNRTAIAITNEIGHYQFTGLAAGQYLVIVNLQGFETAKSNPISVTIGETARFDVKLSPGAVTESITVSSSATQLETGQSNLGVDVSQQQMDDLPMNGQNFTSLAALSPGISTEVQKNINPGGSYSVGSQFSSGGITFTSGGLVQGSRDNGYYINGVNINDNWESSISYEPASEALQNAKVSVADFSAANGHDISTFSVGTKGGSTQFHGTVYEHLENDDLNATNSYDKAEAVLLGTGPAVKPTLRRNQFGFGVGGPAYIPKVSKLRNRFFFFANYEKFIEHDGSQQVTGSVPSTPEKSGDFSELLKGSSPHQLYNPFTTTYDANGYSTRQPIPGNRVDLATKPDGTPLIDPSSAKILSLYPTPTALDTPSYLENYSTTQNAAFSDYHFDSRFDVHISERDSAFVTWSKQHGTNDNSGGILKDYVWDNDDSSWMVTVNEVHIFSPNLTNEFIFGKGTGALTIVSPKEISFLHSSANPLNGVFKNTGTGASAGIFGVDIDNYASPGFDQDFRDSNNAIQFADNVNWIRGRHTMTFGLNYFRKGEYDWSFNRYVSFGKFTKGGYNQDSAGGDAMADLLMGIPRHIHQLDVISGADDTAPELNVRFPYWGGYVNDKYQISPNLTLSVGLRYDLSLPMYDPQKLCCGVYEANSDGGVVAIPGLAAGLSQHYLSAAKKNFAPRVSLAYNPTRRQVIRAGYGIFYDAGASQISASTGFANGATPGGGTDLTNVILGVASDTPALTIADTFPAEKVIPKGEFKVSTGAGQGYFGDGEYYTLYYSDQKSVPLPYYQRYILDVQQTITPQTSITVSYIGAQGRKGTNLSNINLPAYKTGWSTDNAFNAARPNNKGRFGDIYVQRPNLNSFYNAGVISFQHRFSNNYELNSNYTLAKTVSDYPVVNNLANNGAPGGGSGGFQYPNIRNRGESSQSHRQRFVMSGTWSPVYGATWPMWAKSSLTGWKISGIETLESGDRLTVTNGATSAGDYAGPEELNVSGSPNIGHGKKTFLHQFNTSAFTAPSNGVRGNSGLGTVQGPGQNNVDLSLAKNFNIWRTLKANIRADAFNVFNHSQWTGVDTESDNSGKEFGRVTGSREARITQVSMKISF